MNQTNGKLFQQHKLGSDWINSASEKEKIKSQISINGDLNFKKTLNQSLINLTEQNQQDNKNKFIDDLDEYATSNESNFQRRLSFRLSRRTYLNRVNSNINISNRETTVLPASNLNSSFHNGLNQVASLEEDNNNLLKFLQQNNRELSPSNYKHSLSSSNRNGIVFNQNIDIEKLIDENKNKKEEINNNNNTNNKYNNKKTEENLEFEFTMSKSNCDQNESSDTEESNKLETVNLDAEQDSNNLSLDDNNKKNISTSEYDDEIMKYFGENKSSTSFSLKRSQSTSQVDKNNKKLNQKNMDETISSNTTVTPAPNDDNNNNEPNGYGSVRLRSANRLSGLKKLGNLYKQFEDDDFIFNNYNNQSLSSNKNIKNVASQRIAYIDESFDTQSSDNHSNKTKTSNNSIESLNTFANSNKSKNKSTTSLLMNKLEKTNTNSSSLFGIKSSSGGSLSNTNANIETEKTQNLNSNNNSINTSVDCYNNSDFDEDNYSNLSSNKTNSEQNNKTKNEEDDCLIINKHLASSSLSINSNKSTKIDSRRFLFETIDKNQPNPTNSNCNSCASIDNLNDSFTNSNTNISVSKPRQSRFRYSSYLNEIDLTNSNNQLLQIKTSNSSSQIQNSCSNNNSGIVTDRIFKFENQFLTSPKSINTSVTTNSILLDLDDSITSNSFQPLSTSTCISISNSLCANNTNNNLTIKKVNPIDLANTTLISNNNNNNCTSSDQKVKSISKNWEQIVNKNNNGSLMKSSASFSHGYTRPTSIAQKIEKFTQKQSISNTINNQKTIENAINKKNQNDIDTAAKLRMNSGGTNSDEYYEASKDDGFETQSNASSSHNNHENEVNEQHVSKKDKCDSNKIMQSNKNDNSNEENKSITIKSSSAAMNETSIQHNHASSSNKSTSLESISSSRSPQPRDLKSSLTNVSILSNKINSNNINNNNNNNNSNSQQSNTNKQSNITCNSSNVIKRVKVSTTPISRPVSLMHPPSTSCYLNNSSSTNHHHTTLSSNFHATKKALNSYINRVTSKNSNDHMNDTTRKKSGSVSALYLCDTASTKAKKAELKLLKEAAMNLKINNNLNNNNNSIQNNIMNRRNSLGKKSIEKFNNNNNNLNFININHESSSHHNKTSKHFNHHSSQSQTNVFERLTKSSNQVNNIKA